MKKCPDYRGSRLRTIASVALAQTAQDLPPIAITDMFEIQSSQLALSKQPDIKPFAEQMVQGSLEALVDQGKGYAADGARCRAVALFEAFPRCCNGPSNL
jgi:hypothetical protein